MDELEVPWSPTFLTWPKSHLGIGLKSTNWCLYHKLTSQTGWIPGGLSVWPCLTYNSAPHFPMAYGLWKIWSPKIPMENLGIFPLHCSDPTTRPQRLHIHAGWCRRHLTPTSYGSNRKPRIEKKLITNCFTRLVELFDSFWGCARFSTIQFFGTNHFEPYTLVN